MQDLAVLTPSLIVCVAFLAGVFALLRHEMAPRRRDREDGAAADNTGTGSFSGGEDGGSSGASHHEDGMEQQAGRRSSRQA